uniref:Uncharacterized protein n=1 Tax=Haemonchus contortus TaxID=6289 RepID=W6NE99_HAECO
MVYEYTVSFPVEGQPLPLHFITAGRLLDLEDKNKKHDASSCLATKWNSFCRTTHPSIHANQSILDARG